MSPLTLYKPVAEEGFPRVSGDEPCAALHTGDRAAFSPRERG